MIEAGIFHRYLRAEYSLKLLEKADAMALFSTIYRNKAELNQWLPWVNSTRSVTDSKAFIEDSLYKYSRGENMITGIWHRQELIGCIGFNEISLVQRKAVIGYWLAKDYRGKGIVTIACHLLLKYAFEELKLNRIEILCADQNYSSRAVPQRLRFKEDGVLHDYLRLHDQYVDIILYSISRRDWNVANEAMLS